ncbi:MAG: hypothetical protein VKJ87_07345 [Synechococcus sp.]|nr:hypothetical protein [Synechococcus sp.]
MVTDRERELSRQFWDRRLGRRSRNTGLSRRYRLPWWVITGLVVLLLWWLAAR